MSSFASASSQGEGGQSDKWVKLDSNSISSVAFTYGENTLKVHFKDGDTWAYSGVPKSKYDHLVYVSSAGKYLQKEIIPHYKAEKLHDGGPDEQ